MHPFLFLTALCLGIVSATTKLGLRLDAQWIQWKATYGKLYDENERWRRVVWETNMKMIEQHNQEYSQGKHSFTMAMNAFGDLTNEKFRHMMNGLKIQKDKNGKVFKIPFFAEIIGPVDRRQTASFSPVRFQGQSASGWASGAAGAFEGWIFQKTGKLVSLSEQNLLDCSWSQGNKGCRGGLMDYAFQHVRNNGGLDSEESDPYCAQDGSCEYMPDSSAANVTGLVNIPQQVASLLVAVAAVGPVSAAVRASLDPFQFYKEGIYYDPNCSSEDLDHGILVVGYDSQGEEPENQKYWNVKNSWGTDRGTQGYMLLAKDRDNQCGIATMARFPVV
ncbi:cathepsin L1-like [Zalophus californianus]|uniref:Procathepsin L n=1 Tax=Zalophus californianus TaxID=9704 RepID=A0A6J2EV06_ZALCA|nr:cathepsin L1-like [Zalophus californianus]